METFRRTIIIILALAITIPVIMKSRPSGPIPAPAAFSVVKSSISLVRISGDVRHPGIYPITAITMTGDVIKMAEPPVLPKSILPLGIDKVLPINGSEIQFTMNPYGSADIVIKPLPTVQRIVLGIPLDINLMSIDDFDLIPGIGPVLAQRIFEYRHQNGDMMRVPELLKIVGISEKKFNRIKELFQLPEL